MKEIIDNRELRCDLTQDDRNDFTKELTNAILEKSEVEEEKKQAVKAYNQEIKAFNKQITHLGYKLDNDFEMRMISCKVEYNTPRYGVKTITRKDTHESWEEQMSDDEQNLFTPSSNPQDDFEGPTAKIKSFM